MKHRTLLKLTALLLVCALALCGCGKKEPQNSGSNDGAPMALGQWSLTPQTWSSPNGATIHLSAEVTNADKSATAEFVVRQGDGDVANVPCTWEGSQLLAEAELNAADGYGYFLVLTAADGSLTEWPLSGVDGSLVNLASALNSYCNLLVTDSAYENGKLTLTAGKLEIQAPQLTDGGEAITCKETALVLLKDGVELTRAAVTVTASEVPGGFEAELAGTVFTLPAMEEDGQVLLRAEVSLSNGQSLSAEGGAWTYMDGQIVATVG